MACSHDRQAQRLACAGVRRDAAAAPAAARGCRGSALRADTAMRALRRAGLPTPRVEAWKYTNLNRLLSTGFARPGAGQLSTPCRSAARWTGGTTSCSSTARFAAGSLVGCRLPVRRRPSWASREALRQEPGLRRQPRLGRIARPRRMPLMALNTALDGRRLRHALARGAVIEQPMHCRLVRPCRRCAGLPSIRATSSSREAGSRADPDRKPCRGGRRRRFRPMRVTEIAAEAAPRCVTTTCRTRRPTPPSTRATPRRSSTSGARYDSFVLQTGGPVARNEIHVRAGRRAGALPAARRLSAARPSSMSTTPRRSTHAVPRTTSRQIYKGVLDGQARGVFQGRIIVEPDAQKTDGHQLYRTLLLSDQAEIDTKPELEIFADDVKCGHGATAGELDDNALFYLQSARHRRGSGPRPADRRLPRRASADRRTRHPARPWPAIVDGGCTAGDRRAHRTTRTHRR